MKKVSNLWISLGLPGVLAVALLAQIAERFGGFVGGHGLAGAEDPDALLLFERRGAAPGAQLDLVMLHRNIQSVAWGEVQLVPEVLGKDDAARSVERHFAHNSIIAWAVPIGKWYFVLPAVQFYRLYRAT